jgi:hypothetical protein
MLYFLWTYTFTHFAGTTFLRRSSPILVSIILIDLSRMVEVFVFVVGVLVLEYGMI